MEPESSEDAGAALPPGVRDTGAEDAERMATYKDIYYMVMELQFPIRRRFLTDENNVRPKVREVLLNWLVQVHQAFNLLPQTFQLTVGILDRYLQLSPYLRYYEVQVAGVAALYLATKYEEPTRTFPHQNEFVVVGDGAYNIVELVEFEWDILKTLDFCLGRPTPLVFLTRYLKAANCSPLAVNLANYFVELCVVSYSMAHCRPSKLAAAAVCLALYVLPAGAHADRGWPAALDHRSTYSARRLRPAMTRVARLVVRVRTTDFVYARYLDGALDRVSSLPQLRSRLLHNLAGVPFDEY